MSLASPLANPAALPLIEVEALLPNHSGSPFLIVAPHPDDETLGCGGAIALLRQLAQRVKVLVISDGTRSHPNSRQYPAPALRALREQETLAALSILGLDSNAVTFVRLPDGAVPTPDKAEFSQALAFCRSYLSESTPATIFLPWRTDPHRDHRATWQLIHTALQDLPFSPRLIEYPIWDWDLKQRGVLAHVTAWRLDISRVIERKQKAIAQYRSQTTNLIDDDPQGFRLTPAMLANFTHPWEVYLEAKSDK